MQNLLSKAGRTEEIRRLAIERGLPPSQFKLFLRDTSFFSYCSLVGFGTLLLCTIFFAVAYTFLGQIFAGHNFLTHFLIRGLPIALLVVIYRAVIVPYLIVRELRRPKMSIWIRQAISLAQERALKTTP
ncbi:MAG: hypothetical protein KDN22_14120 [Verrucomicrobiae bacterium]|nr:hypothetical protein [Verrucomicrobiae bacterium]